MATITAQKKREPITKMTGQLFTGNVVTYDLSGYGRANTLFIRYSVTRNAVAAGTPQAPYFTDILNGPIILRSGSRQIRNYQATDIFGGTGLHAADDPYNAGSVFYSQAGNNTLSIVPVPIGSAADQAQRVLTTQNVACTATFVLPIPFVEYYRKEYDTAEMMGLVLQYTGGAPTGNWFLDVLTAPAVINGLTIVPGAFQLSMQYDDVQIAPGAPIYAKKFYRFNVPYSGSGQLEISQQIPLTAGLIQRVSILTSGTDYVSAVEVKKDKVTQRNCTFEENLQELATCDMNIYAIPRNRFDVDFEVNDDPYSALPVNSNTQLSIKPTLVAGGGGTLTVLVAVWGDIAA